MRDYKKYAQDLRRIAQFQNCFECYEGERTEGSCSSRCTFNKAADAIEELLDELTTIRKQLPHWISVEDRLPKPGERVLITNGSFVCESYQSQGKRWMRHGCYMDYMQPTHWMPLPEQPKGVE